jgi:septal ring factor EnvC (AmiA/AmiB activator)
MRRPISLLAASVFLLLPAALAADAPTPDSARQTLAKWVETQQLIAKEKRDWADGKEILTSRIDVLKGEIESVKGNLAEARKTSAEANSKKAGTIAESETLQDVGAGLA